MDGTKCVRRTLYGEVLLAGVETQRKETTEWANTSTARDSTTKMTVPAATPDSRVGKRRLRQKRFVHAATVWLRYEAYDATLAHRT